jgi:drug/metabolite transporter (DMT)-like permease
MKIDEIRNKWSFGVGVFLVIISALGFSAKSIFVKLAFQETPNPILILALRMIFSLPFFLMGIFFQRKNLPKDKNLYFQIILYGILGNYIASIFDFYGLEYISAGLERIILFTYPTIVVVLSFIFLKKPLHKKEIFSLFLTYGGILSIFLGEGVLMDKNNMIGVMLVFLAAIAYSGFLIGSGNIIPKMGAVLYTSVAMTTASVTVIFHYIIVFPIEGLFNNSIRIYLLTFLMAIISTVIPVFLLSQGIKRIGSSKSAIVGSVGPVSTLILGNIFLNEPIHVSEIFGTVILISGVLLVSSSKKEVINEIK